MGGVDCPADPGRPEIGDSAVTLWAGLGEVLRAGVEIAGLGPPVRAVRLPIESKLTLSSSCWRRLRMEEESRSYPQTRVSDVERTPEDEEA